ncbi:hypothetical protein [Nesterenkonia pannonica]|uniref:hypothetical protein n=1 Tax=Nesterenkonia pannonica TaxID=1548602 RepID=UPI0021647374|nr:hypothetical protein [Nesterenkonia pannonica]
MSEEQSTETTETTEPNQPLQEVTDQPEYTAQGAETPSESETDWKAKFEAQKKVNQDLEKKVKGEAGTLQQQLSEARKEAESNATKALRYEVAAEKGIPLEAAARLTGETKEELESDAEKLQALLGTSPRAAFAPGKHQDPETKPSPNDLIRAAMRTT